MTRIGTFSFTTNPYRGVSPRGRPVKNAKKTHHPIGTEDFVCIDGEGVTLPSGEHRYVLLGCGDFQIEDPKGLHIKDIMSFLYEQQTVRTAYCGFFLGYDFTQWFKTLPENRAWKLLTSEGKESRRSRSQKMVGKFLPVDYDEWQLDVLGNKQFKFRMKECDCPMVKCEHPKGRWMYICDSGPFFQTSFLNVIDPANWQDPIVTVEEFEIVKRGKESRSSAQLDDDMRYYNKLENRILARVLHDLNSGFAKLDVKLSPQQWYGPGQAAQLWMKGRAPLRTEIVDVTPEWFLDAARQSYFGGWFELQAHGIVPGTSYENDINSAYPFLISSLPCLLHGTYRRGTGRPPALREGEICLVHALVWGQPPHSPKRRGNAIGAMLHRDRDGRICRPLITSGWFWLDELQAAQRAKFITRITSDRFYEWMIYTPCDCPPPLRETKFLYQRRQDVGKKSSLGKSSKTVMNSEYGKVCQSVGAAVFANAIYASRITSGCRTIITDAIATHPGGKANVLMVATDAVFFRDPHPLLSYGPGLGEWETKERTNLTLFKPGVYWDDDSRAVLDSSDHIAFKARGISARDFAASIGEIDRQFAEWASKGPPSIEAGEFTPEELQAMGRPAWPRVTYTSKFAMTTALQALMRNDWDSAGDVDTNKELVQSSNPSDKRRDLWQDGDLFRSEPLEVGGNAVYRSTSNIGAWLDIIEERFDTVPYEKRFGLEDPYSEESTTRFGISPDEHEPYRGMFRLLTGAE